MFFNPPFIGKFPNIVSNFTGGDTEELLQQSLYSQANDWYYRDVEITYSFNEYGHRCKNISEIDLNNYILFTGCSHTEGVGLELEKIYTHLVASELGCDYYNLAISGVGMDIMLHNLLIWFQKVKTPPKYLFVQWPQNNRFIKIVDNNIQCINGSSATDRKTLEFMLAGEEIGYFSAKQKLHDYAISQLNVPRFDITFEKDESIPHATSITRNDLARDLAHAGVMSHQRLASNLLKLI